MIQTRRLFLRQSGSLLAGFGLASMTPDYLRQPSTFAQLLPRSSPEAQGMSSKSILAFLEALETSVHEFHGFVLLKNGHVVADGWWKPYGPKLNHSLYSMSKSFTSTAIGLAAAEGLLKTSDKVVSFFPNDLPQTVGENLKNMEIRHLLMMSVGHATDSTWEMIQEKNWVRKFLSFPVEKAPGSVFLYNSGATYMCSAILQKVTGKTVLDFLTPRLFKPLGIKGAEWDACPMGISVGGWGLRLKTEDQAKFGQLYLQKGKWNGKQILPAAWVEEATSFKINNRNPDNQRPAGLDDWGQGYCYQFWRCRHNAYRGDGAFGQYTIVFPDQNAILAIHSETPDLQGVLDLVYDRLLTGMQSNPLPSDPVAHKQLHVKLKSLAIAPPKGQPAPGIATAVSGMTYKVEPNDNKVETLRFQFTDKSFGFSMKNYLGVFQVKGGIQHWLAGETRMPGTPPNLFPIPYEQMSTSKIMASGHWKDAQTFVITLQYFETAHHDTITCRFDGNQVQVDFLNSVSEMIDFIKEKRVPLKGIRDGG
jgi:CubicO group peptidase (beta-lactamase class C family)